MNSHETQNSVVAHYQALLVNLVTLSVIAHQL